MANQLSPWIMSIFPVFFIGLWLLMTIVFGLMSGWYGLMSRFPNRPETPIRRFKNLSGSMGAGVNMSGILKISVCPSGLRIGIWRIFGPFCRDFFVPWSQLRVIRRNRILWQVAELNFGSSRAGRLKIEGYMANRLARAAAERWPEAGSFPPESAGQAFFGVFIQWLAVTTFAGLFFFLAPRLAGGSETTFPPIWIGFLFPAIVFGIYSLPRFFARISR
jgi:hypothetical protein